MLSHGHIAPPPIARDCSRSFDTGHSRLKIFHHRMLRDRTLLSPSSLPSLLSVWSFYLPVSPPKVKTCVISHSPFFFFFIFLQSPSLIQSPPLFLLPRSRDRSADQVLEPSKIRSIYPSPLLPSLSNAEDRYVPQGFGANLPTPGREMKGRGSRGCETREKEGGCRSNSRWFNSPARFFFPPRNRWTERARNCSRVCGTRMIGDR